MAAAKGGKVAKGAEAAKVAEPEPELPDGVYRKEISEEQLSKFYEAAYTSHEDMIKFLAEVLGLRDISWKARNAIIVDYFSGFLLFTKEAELSLPTTFHVWKLSHDMLDIIMGHASFEEAKHHFKKLLLKLSVIQFKGDVPQLTPLECQKIAPFFTTTVFQHYTLLSYCFSHNHEYWFKTEHLRVQTPLLYPHNIANTQRELDADKATWEAYEVALLVYNFVQHFKLWGIEKIMETPNVDCLPPEEYVKAMPESIDECIERLCRHLIEESTKSFQDDYQGRELKMLRKLIALEVKCGIAEAKMSTKMSLISDATTGDAPLPK